MKAAPQISVIVPVYNAEIFLKSTLDSLFSQTFQDFEVIAVNDGSSDNSLSILRFYEQKHPNLTVIDQENAGQSAARNAAIEAARGEYLAFLDSDDVLLPTFLEELNAAACSSGADISVCSYYRYYPKNGWKLHPPFVHRSCTLDRNKALSLLVRDLSIHYYLWNKLFRRSLFTEHSIKMPSMCFEDMVTTPKIFAYSNRIAIIKRPLYLYTKHPGSLMSNSSQGKRIDDYIDAIGLLRNFLEKENVYSCCKGSFRFFACRCIFSTWMMLFCYHFSIKSFHGFWGELGRSTSKICHFIGKGYFKQGTQSIFSDQTKKSFEGRDRI